MHIIKITKSDEHGVSFPEQLLSFSYSVLTSFKVIHILTYEKLDYALSH